MSNITTDSSSPPPPVRHAPCAVCEHLRRRCRQDCPFALHFPGERPTCLDFLCLAYGAPHAARMLLVLNRGEWTSAAHSLVYNAILRLQNSEREALQLISRLQSQVIDMQVRNLFPRNHGARHEWPANDLISIYDLIEWPANDQLAGMNEPPGGQTGRPPASGPGGGSEPPGGQYGAPSSSGDNDRRRQIGPS